MHCVKSVRSWSSFWSLFYRIWTKYGDLLFKSPYSSPNKEKYESIITLGHMLLCLHTQNDKSIHPICIP